MLWGLDAILRRKLPRSLAKYSWQDQDDIRQLDAGDEHLTPIRFEQLVRHMGRKRAVSWLSRYLAAGGDVNAAHPESGWTLLHNAAELGNLSLIEALVKSGANLNARNHQGWTPLHLAVDAEIGADHGGGREE